MNRPLKYARRPRQDVAFSLVLIILLGLAAGCAGPSSGPRDDPAALGEMQAQRRRDRSEPYWPFELAQVHLRAGDRALATAYLDTALALDADYAPAVVLRSQLQYEDGRFTAATALLQGHLARNTEAPDAVRVALALNLQALDNLADAVDILAACRKQNTTAQTARVFAQLQGDDYLDSLTAAEAALRDDPGSAANHNNLGVSLLYAGQPRAARQAFVKALQIEPELPGGLYNLAIVENFYFFDPDAGREYFRRYQDATRDWAPFDPDDLASLLGGAALAAGTGSEADHVQ